MITIEELSFGYEKDGDTPVFDGLTCTLPTNRRFAIVGAPESGKSSLIRLLAGLLSPDTGTITRGARLSYPIGFGGGFRPTLTVRQNIRFICDLYEADVGEVTDFIARVGDIEHCLDEPFVGLTSRERIHLSFALSYAIPFDTYLVDGIIGAGDNAFRERCSAMLDGRAEQGGIILATRHIRTAERHANCGCLLVEGQLEFFDDMGDLGKRFAMLRERAPEPTVS